MTSKEILKNVIKEYLRLLNRDHLKWSTGSTVYDPDMECLDVELMIEGHEDPVIIRVVPGDHYYKVSVLCTIDVVVNTLCEPLGLEEKDVSDYDNLVEKFYDHLDNTGEELFKHVCKIPFTEDIPKWPYKVVTDRLDEWIETLNRGNFDTVENMLIYWYIHEIYLPAFLDQTAKHMVNGLASGVPEFYIEDVYKHIAEEVEYGRDLEDILKSIEQFFAS